MSAEVRRRKIVAHATAKDDAHEDEAVRRVGASLAGVVVCDARLLLIAVWLGAAVFFSFAVAPAAFGVLPTRELAGTLVTRTLSVVNVGGFFLSLLLLLSLPFEKGATTRRALFAEAGSLVLIAVATAVGQLVIAARLLALRARMGAPIDSVAQDEPLRVAFNSLHGYSVAALSIAMLAAIVALLLIARRARTVV
ncbi:MAG: DUF4149 domain-containing protein [Acidobacteria bacterium]|nr:DUF4149 domain-containing protein [Acidobacteriota bacterium]